MNGIEKLNNFLFLDKGYKDFAKKSYRGNIPYDIFRTITIQNKFIDLTDIDLNGTNPVAELSALENLELFSCTFMQNIFPYALYTLTTLCHLALTHTHFESPLSSFAGFALLQRVELTHLQLDAFPPNLFCCTELESIDVSNNQITCIPEAIGAIPILKVLIANNNLIEEIPTTLMQSTTLTNLYLCKNQIKVIPETIALCTALVEFHINLNPIEKVIDPARCKSLSPACREALGQWK